MAKLVLSILRNLECQPNTVLDIACGEGTFAIAMAKTGLDVIGIDRSKEMLRIAREQAKAANLLIEFYEMDMRQLDLRQSFDLITCWFDSLNYLLTLNDLKKAFKAIYDHMNPDGLFIFDMNTIYWLKTLADRYAVIIEKETSDVFQVHRHTYDKTTRIATFHLIAFLKENDCWQRRVDETHHERGYTLDEIRSCLNTAGLSEIACYGNLEERLPYTKESKRVWFITKK